MKRFVNAYRQALGLFAVWEVSFDAVKSFGNIFCEAAFILASVLWIVGSPALALLEVWWPGSMDRLLFRLAR